MRTFLRFLMKFIKLIFYAVIFGAIFIFIFYFILNLFTEPSNSRRWNTDQQLLPTATINGDLVHIKNIRNFTYASTTSFTPNYYDADYDLSKLKRAWYIVEPFSGIPGSAHTFLSFEFEDENENAIENESVITNLQTTQQATTSKSGEIKSNSRFVAISVEIRKEIGESFHPVKGLLNQYEIMYVIGDEKDLIKLRTNYRQDKVYLYPAKTSPEKVRELFVDMLSRANSLAEHPEFYNTVTNTCTTNIVRHVNKITPGKLPWLSSDILFPASSDELAFKLGLIDTDLDFEATREHFYITDIAKENENAPDFSQKIREKMR